MQLDGHKICSRCGRAGCRNIDDETLHSEVGGVGDRTRIYLSKTFYSCLCETCLWHVRDLVQRAGALRMPETPEALESGLHYSIENGLLVFSELYHVLKGYCCRNGCKNCAYGYTRKRTS